MQRSRSVPLSPTVPSRAYLVRADPFRPIDLSSPMRNVQRKPSAAAARAKTGGITNVLGGADLLKRAAGPAWMTNGPMQWQCQGRWGWVDCSSDTTSLLEQAYMLGNNQISVWSTSGLVSYDFELMLELPGHRRIRRVERTRVTEDPIPSRIEVFNDTPCELRRCSDVLRFQTPPPSDRSRREQVVTPPRVPAVTPEKTIRQRSSQGIRSRSNSSVALHTGALQKLVHPQISRLEEPRFHCGEPSIDLLPLGVVEASIEREDLDDIEVVSELAKEYAARLCVPALMLPVKGTARQTMAALSIALHRFEGTPKAITFYTSDSSPESRKAMVQVRDAWCQWRKAIRKQLGFQLEELERCRGNFSWISEEAPPPQRLARLACASASLCHALNLQSTEELIADTRLLPWLPRSRPSGLRNFREAQLAHSNRSALQTAALYECDGFVTAAVVEASGYIVGGRLLEGGAHGIEEEACTQSTLFTSLLEASRRAKATHLRDSSGRRVHIPQNGAVLSPGVEVFRRCSREGYRPLNQSVQIAATLSISMPNLSQGDLSTGPAVQISTSALEQMIKQKLEMVVQGADSVRAEVLVVPDVGCSQHGSCPAQLVGRCLGQVLRSDPGNIQKVVLTGRAEFQRAVFLAVSGHAPTPNYDEG